MAWVMTRLCLHGPDVVLHEDVLERPSPGFCWPFDVDGDDRVDLFDFAEWVVSEDFELGCIQGGT